MAGGIMTFRTRASARASSGRWRRRGRATRAAPTRSRRTGTADCAIMSSQGTYDRKPKRRVTPRAWNAMWCIVDSGVFFVLI